MVRMQIDARPPVVGARPNALVKLSLEDKGNLVLLWKSRSARQAKDTCARTLAVQGTNASTMDVLGKHALTTQGDYRAKNGSKLCSASIPSITKRKCFRLRSSPCEGGIWSLGGAMQRNIAMRIKHKTQNKFHPRSHNVSVLRGRSRISLWPSEAAKPFKYTFQKGGPPIGVFKELCTSDSQQTIRLLGSMVYVDAPEWPPTY